MSSETKTSSSVWQTILWGPPRPRKKGWKPMLLWIAMRVGMFYLLWCSILFLLQDRMIFPRSGMENQVQNWSPPSGFESIWLNNPNGEKVEGWYYKASDKKRPLVIYFHGNAEIIDFTYQRLRFYSEQMNFHLFLPEYRGYGRSTGSPGQNNIHNDMKKFLQILQDKPEVDYEKIIYHGRSIGSGVACDLISYKKPQFLVLESAFYNLGRKVRGFFVPGAFLRHPFRNNEVISQLDIPIFIIHGRKDQIFPIQHAIDLDRLAKNSHFVEVDAGHNDLSIDWELVKKFLEEGNKAGK